MKQRIVATMQETANLLQIMAEDASLLAAIEQMVTSSITALRNGNKLMFCGNGGSAADAQHWAGELVSRFYYDRPGLPAIALTTDTSIITSIGNDYGFDYSFARQVEALGVRGDVLIAISTSGNSRNVLAALEAARKKGMITVGFTGKEGGSMPAHCDICLKIPSSLTPRIQEGHEVIGHTLCMLVEEALFPRKQA